jgi:hypothetical protein
VVAEVDDVQVAIEDLLLGHLLLEAGGEHDLLGLALERLLRPELLELHELLGDRRAALADAAGVDVGLERPQHAAEVVAVVHPEAGVLDRQDGVHHVGRDLGQRDGLAVLLVLERRDELAVGGVHVRPLGERTERKPPRLARAHVADEARGHGERGHGGGEHYRAPDDDGGEAGKDAAHGERVP